MFLIVAMYLALAVILGILMWVYIRGNVANLFRQPISLALLGLLIIHALLPLVQYPIGMYRYAIGGYSLLVHAHAIGLAFIFAVTMVGAYSMFGSTKEQYRSPVLFEMSRLGRQYLFVGVIIPAMIAGTLYYRNIMSFGFEAWATDRIWYSDHRIGLSALFCRWLYVSFIIAGAGYFTSARRSKGMLLLFVALGITVIVFFGFIQSRNAIYLSFIAAMGVHFVTSPKDRITLKSLIFSKVAVILCILFVTMIVVQRMRPKTREAQYDTLGVIVLKVLNGAFGNHENVLWMVDNEFEYQYGATYFAGLVNIYPRMLWPNKPLGAGPFMKNLVNPGSYVVGGEGMSSLTTGMVTESYMNGGLVGVLICAVLTGFVLRFLVVFRNKCYGPWAVAIYCYSALLLGYGLTYGEFLGTYTRWLTDMAPMVIGYILCEFLLRPSADEMSLIYDEMAIDDDETAIAYDETATTYD